MTTDDNKDFLRIEKDLKKLSKLKLRIFIDEEKTYESGEEVSEVAVLMEYGWDEFETNYPSRPFFRSSIDANLKRIKALFEKYLDSMIEGKNTPEQVFEKLGGYIVKKIKETIMKGEFAPLAESTIAQKGSSKPLIDTKTLYQSIRYEVEVI